MTAFFICIILIGVLMTATAMIWMVIEKKKSKDYRLETEEHKHDLQQAIDDAEQLLEELNNFSGYIVTRMEEKQQEVEEVIQAADQRLNLFEQIEDIQIEMPAMEMEGHAAESTLVMEPEPPAATARKAKVIPLNEKRRQVIKLYKDGLDSTEIAKLLNMGKGEIELISKMVQ
jgi:transcriptional regulator of heat shock response